MAARALQIDPRIDDPADGDADARFQARAAVARLEAGATADHPMVVSSSSLVELEATSRPCLRCLARVRVEDHTVEHPATGLVRVAHIKCPQCTLRRLMYFRIAAVS